MTSNVLIDKEIKDDHQLTFQLYHSILSHVSFPLLFGFLYLEYAIFDRTKGTDIHYSDSILIRNVINHDQIEIQYLFSMLLLVILLLIEIRNDRI